MPFDSAVAPFVGDDDLGDFLLDVWMPFVSGQMGWVANQTPNSLTLPNADVWTHRGTTGAPEPPFIFLRTNGDQLWHFTGTGIDTGLSISNQPGNPGLSPYPGDFTTPTNNDGVRNNMQCPFSNSLTGPYEAYWLFGDMAGSYVHCVIKVAARQYRHFHVGLFKGLHPDLNADSFYVTCHMWGGLDPDGITFDSTDDTRAPYGSGRMLPFQGARIDNSGTTTFSKKHAMANLFYLPGLRTETDWYIPRWNTAGLATETNSGGAEMGFAEANGYGGFGNILFNCDKTFTSGLIPLLPIYLGVGMFFDSADRLGVVAQVPDVYRVNMRDLTPEQEIVIGSETYVVFPMMNDDSANTLAGEGYSAWEGLAYRKETGAVT